MTDSAHTIGIVEDDPQLRQFLETVVADSPDLRLLFSVAKVEDALRALASGMPALCLVDLKLPDGSGLAVIRRIKRQGEGKVLVLSVLADRTTVMEVLRAGADGYVLKSGRAASIQKEIRQTLTGETAISPQIAGYLLELVRQQPAAAAGQGEADDAGLTARETEVLNLLARGLSYREAADTLAITANTVGDHVKRIYAKLNVHSRGEAVFEAQARGLLDERGRLTGEETP